MGIDIQADPNTRAHTQGIERSWLNEKIRVFRKKREGLQSNNISITLRLLLFADDKQRSPDPYLAFLAVVRVVYR